MVRLASLNLSIASEKAGKTAGTGTTSCLSALTFVVRVTGFDFTLSVAGVLLAFAFVVWLAGLNLSVASVVLLAALA